MSWWVLLLLLSNYYRQSSANLCGPTEYAKHGKCCSLCKAGQRLHKECTINDDTECLSCMDGEYQDKWNQETSCLLHTVCERNLGFEKLSEGTAERNVNCSCQKGKHCSSNLCESCVWNTLCGPGEGVKQAATRFSDTQCEPCQKGTFSNVKSDIETCKHWKRCSGSQEEMYPGNDSTDVVCGPHRVNNIWIYAVMVFIVLVCLSVLLILYVQKQKKMKKIQDEEDAPEKTPVEIPQFLPEKENLLLGEEHTHANLPEEDQDLTIQGLPIAQEEGKDYHMSQEEK